MTINTGSIQKALTPGVKSWFGMTYDEHQEEFSKIFDQDTSKRAWEEDVQVTGFGLAPVKTQGGGITYVDQSQGYTSRYTHIAYALGFIITYEAMEDNLYNELGKKRSQALARSMRQTKERVGANILNRGFNSSFTGGDGVQLLATTHPTAAGNQSNILSVAADLSEQALEDLCIQIMDATDDNGLKIGLNPKKLIIPTALVFEAERVLKSVQQNDTANNAINALKSKGAIREIVVNHYLTDADAFFIKTDAPRGLTHYQRSFIPLQEDNDKSDTMNLKYYSYDRYSFGWSEWRGTFGSAGA